MSKAVQLIASRPQRDVLSFVPVKIHGIDSTEADPLEIGDLDEPVDVVDALAHFFAVVFAHGCQLDACLP